ncbi:tubulin-tyrsoine ligase-like protein, partial [Trypanosoma cruzi]
TCLVSSEISSPLLAPEDAPVNGGRAPLSAAVVNLHKTNQAVAPVSVVPLRWRASSHVRPQQDAEAECEEPDADRSHLTVVTQRGPIHKASGDCYKQVSPSVGAVWPNMSARVTGPYFSGGKSENAGRPGTNAALSQRSCSLSKPRIDNTLQRPNERSSSEAQNGDRVSARRKLRRRHSSNAQGNNNTNNLAKLDVGTENKPNSSPPGAVD